jgi:hypothetical protein
MTHADVLPPGEGPAEQSSFAYRVADWVTHDRLDDVVMAIDLETGNYFSLDDVAADAWTLLANGMTLHDASVILAERYAVALDRMFSDLQAYADSLEEQRLLARDERRTPPVPAVELPPRTSPRGYSAPVLQRYDDLDALLRLDPIHEVDELGWPVHRAD